MAVAAAGLLAAGVTGAAVRGSSTAVPPLPTSPAPTAAHPLPATATCTAAVDAEDVSVARHVYDQAVAGPNLRDSIRRLQRSRALATAVAADDPRATRDALRPLLRADIKRVVIMHGSRVLAAAGSGAALAPVSGVIDDAAGARVGSYRLSGFGDAGLAGLIHSLTGARVVVRAGNREIAATSRAGGAGTSVARLSGVAYPSGPLTISLYTHAPRRTLCEPSASATTASATAAVGERLYRGERTSAQTRRVLGVVAHDPRFIRAVATDDPAALRAQIVRFFQDPRLHVVRIRAVTARGTLVNDVGGPYVLAPASAAVRDHGTVVGTVTLSIQDDTGYIKLMRRFTGAQAILRTPAGQVPGSAVTPGPLPDRGSVTVGGRRYTVASFAATAFPADPLRISLLIGS